jgi:hypothetical protein
MTDLNIIGGKIHSATVVLGRLEEDCNEAAIRYTHAMHAVEEKKQELKELHEQLHEAAVNG